MTMENDILTCIRERRSTRRFKTEQITPEQRDTLLESAIWAPSGGNNQKLVVHRHTE